MSLPRVHAFELDLALAARSPRDRICTCCELPEGNRIHDQSPRPTAARTKPRIKAIETAYAGHRFRSRLEARWAVWFDTLGIDWSYEPQGYEVGRRKRRYLPDFYLKDQRTWVEVKGDPDAVDFDLLVDAAHPKSGLPLQLDCPTTDWPLLKLRLLILGEIPENPLFHHAIVIVKGTSVAHQMVVPICVPPVHPGVDHSHAISPINGPQEVRAATGPTRYERPKRLLASWGYGFPCSQIEDAYRAARSSRFEHGESGPPRAVA